MAARVHAHGPRRRTAIAATLALTAIVSAPLLETTLAGQSAAAPASSGEPLDYDAIYRIKDEAAQPSQVMETLSYLTDVHGPRLTNSPNMRAAADWAQAAARGLRARERRARSWGPFGRGWVNERTVAMMTAPQPFPLLAFPKAWTPGTDGRGQGRRGARHHREGRRDFAQVEGQAEGQDRPASRRPARCRRSSSRRRGATTRRASTDLSKPPMDPSRARPLRPRAGPAAPAAPPPTSASSAWRSIKEGVLALVEMSPGDRGDNGAVSVQAPPEGESQRQTTDAPVLPQIVRRRRALRPAAARSSTRRSRWRSRSTSRTASSTPTSNSLNVIAEMPGTDKADEVVMIGAHFDSWHSGTGATDNGVSSAVMMEAMRILQGDRPEAAPHHPDGRCGPARSRACSARAPTSRSTSPTAPTWSSSRSTASSPAYLNMDNGGGAFRGVYLQGNEAVAPIFEAWMKPFAQPRDEHADDPSDRRHRSPVVRRGRPARLPVHPGSARVRLAHAPHQPGRLRARDPGGPDAERDHHRDLRVSRREARPAAAAQAAAEAAAGRDHARPAPGDDAAADRPAARGSARLVPVSQTGTRHRSCASSTGPFDTRASAVILSAVPPFGTELQSRRHDRVPAASAAARLHTDRASAAERRGVGVARRRVGGTVTDEPAVLTYVSRKLPLRRCGSTNVCRGSSTWTARKWDRRRRDRRPALRRRGHRGLSAVARRLSIGAADGAGTAGAVMYDRRDSSVVLLTNSHVLTVTANPTTLPANTIVSQPWGGRRSASASGSSRRSWRRSGPPAAVPARVDAGIVQVAEGIAAQFDVVRSHAFTLAFAARRMAGIAVSPAAEVVTGATDPSTKAERTTRSVSGVIAGRSAIAVSTISL